MAASCQKLHARGLVAAPCQKLHAMPGVRGRWRRGDAAADQTAPTSHRTPKANVSKAVQIGS